MVWIYLGKKECWFFLVLKKYLWKQVVVEAPKPLPHPPPWLKARISEMRHEGEELQQSLLLVVRIKFLEMAIKGAENL